jgi:Flp pilus assembly protein TadG
MRRSAYWSLDFMVKARTMRNLREESGQTVVSVAFFMGLLALGFVGFALDVGALYREKRMAQSAAQAAAVAAAEEVGSNNSANEQAIANAMAKLNGFDTTLATNPATVTLTTPATGNFAGSYVQATVRMPVHTFFMGAFSHGMATVPVSATAIAGGGISNKTCICVAGNINISNGATVTATGCGIYDNSSSAGSIAVTGGSTINSLFLGGSSSGWYPGITANGDIINVPTIVQGASQQCSSTLPAVPAYSNCVADPGGSFGTFTFGPSSAGGTKCYKALTVGANGSTCTLNPGIYVITTGALHFESGANGWSNLGGNGVFIYLTGTASLVIDNGANVNLVSGGATESSRNGGGAAPAIGPYNGIAIFQDPSDTAAMSFQGGSSTYMNGGVLAPNAAMTLGNGSGSTTKGGIYAGSLTVNGGGVVNAIVNTTESSLTIFNPNPKLVQ